MKTTIIVALISAAALMSGCNKDKGSSDKGDKGGDDLAGVPQACQDYIKKYEACFKNLPATMPAVAKKAMKDAFEQQRKAFKSASTPEAKKALETGCKASLDALAKNPQCK